MGWWPWKGKWRVPAAVALTALLCCAPAGGDSQWQGLPYSVSMTAVQRAGQATTGSTTLTLAHGEPCTVSVSAPVAGAQVLTLGGVGSGGPTLTTSYMLTGIASGDADWVPAGNFLTRTYAVGGTGVATLTLSVKGDPPGGRAAEAGNYTATIILTVTF
jgi:hypothetical protein